MSKKKTLVLVESPSKSKKIQQWLGSQYTVLATIGSMLDIKNAETDSEKKKYDHFGVDTKTWDLNLKVTNRKQFSIIKKEVASGKYDEILLSTDPDRAGTTLGQEVVDKLAPEIKKHKITVHRAVWHEISEKAVREGIKNKHQTNQLEVDAGKARQTYDRLFGFAISGVVQRTINARSAGRVQSPALRLVVDREKERLAFVKAKYMSMNGLFNVASKQRLNTKLISFAGKKIASGGSFDSKGQLKDKDHLVITPDNAEKMKKIVTASKFTVSDISSRPYTRKPPPPYTTATFQQDVGTRYHLSSKNAMSIAQKLYEESLITYIRTDSVFISPEAITSARKTAVQLFGKDSIPAKPRVYKAKGKAQEAHEAIRVTLDDKGNMLSPSSLSRKLASIDPKAKDVYTAIYNRTIASQMNDAKGWTTTVKIESIDTPKSETSVFSAAATQIVEPGWTALTALVSDDKEEGGVISEALEVGEKANLAKVELNEHETQPPARYTEVKLVQILSETGIGRPSTYATIVTINQTRGYVKKKGQQLYPTWEGFKVAQYLEDAIPSFVAYDATAKLEDDLDKIEQGSLRKDDFLKQAWSDIESKVMTLSSNVNWDEVNEVTLINLNDRFQIKTNKFGSFLEDKNSKVDEKGHRKGAMLNDTDTVLNHDFSDISVCEEIFKSRGQRVEARTLGVLDSGEYEGWTVTAQTGKFGPYIMAAHPDHVAALAEGKKPTSKTPAAVTHKLSEDHEVETVSLKDVSSLFDEIKLPRWSSDKKWVVGIGKRGPYVGHKPTQKGRMTFYSLGDEDPRTIPWNDAKKLFKSKDEEK